MSLRIWTLHVLRFGLVGGVGAAVETVALWALVTVGMPPLAGKVVAAELSILVMFHVNDGWTFRKYRRAGGPEYWRRLATSHVNRLLGLGVALGVFAGLTATTTLHYLVANLVSIGAGFVVNFAFEAFLTWRLHHGHAPPIEPIVDEGELD